MYTHISFLCILKRFCLLCTHILYIFQIYIERKRGNVSISIFIFIDSHSTSFLRPLSSLLAAIKMIE